MQSGYQQMTSAHASLTLSTAPESMVTTVDFLEAMLAFTSWIETAVYCCSWAKLASLLLLP